MTAQLNELITTRWPTRFTSHLKVYVLLISWENDDLGVDRELRALKQVFQVLYNYAVEEWEIPSVDAYFSLLERVRNFVNQSNDEDTLFILYYGGHAYQEHGQPGPIWCSTRWNPKKVESIGIFPILGGLDADVLLLFDSCQAVPSSVMSSGKGIILAITATGFEPGAIAAEVGPDSFTQSLVDELALFANSGWPFSDMILHASLTNRLKIRIPSLIKKHDGSLQVDDCGRPFFEQFRRKTPHYIFLSKGKAPRPIPLVPLPKAIVRQSEPHQGIAAKGVASAAENYTVKQPTKQLILTADLAANTFDPNALARWVLKSPNDIRNIQVSMSLSCGGYPGPTGMAPGNYHANIGRVTVGDTINIGSQYNIHFDGDESKYRCLADLRITDPRHDKTRIELTKGGLLAEAYSWILDTSEFQRFQNDPQSRLLWIKADPGMGKTMLLCGIIDELEKTTTANGNLLSYFFCQATDMRINSATSVLRGLIYLLFNQKPPLLEHVLEKYRQSGRAIFEDINAWINLSEIFTNILRDSVLNTNYFVIDALDECTIDLPRLLDLIIHTSSTYPVKWIVSSRNRPQIEEQLSAGYPNLICLELHAQTVSTAVNIYIREKVRNLSQLRRYSRDTEMAVLNHLSSNAHGTFLWAALVCQHLEVVPKWKTLATLATFPPGLDSLYGRMIQQIQKLDDASLYMQILAVAAIVHRPLTLQELPAILGSLEAVSEDPESLPEIIGHCGSFLTLREETVYFVHQSAKDFLLGEASDIVFPFGVGHANHGIFSRSLHIMSQTLRRDIYGLQRPGCPIDEAQSPDPDPLGSVRYSCLHWVDHLCDTASSTQQNDNTLQDNGVVHTFLQNKYLYWLEALSLVQGMSEGVIAMGKLEQLLGCVERGQLAGLVRDARRFILHSKSVIENAPLQAYAAALVFSPAHNLVRSLFGTEEPKWITTKPAVEAGWDACLQTLEGHSDWVNSVVFSFDGQRLASASSDHTIRIWDPATGNCLQTLEGHSDWVNSVAFSSDSQRLASASHDRTVRIWDPATGNCLQTLRGHSNWTNSVTFSFDGQRLASASSDYTIKIWDPATGNCVQTLRGHSNWINSVVFLFDGQRLASASSDHTIKIWDPATGNYLQTLKGHSDSVNLVEFLFDGQRLASASNDYMIKIWDLTTGYCLQTLEGHSNSVKSVTFTGNGQRLASSSADHTVKTWDLATGICLQTLKGHSSSVKSVAFRGDGQQLASSSDDCTIRIWDPAADNLIQVLEGHSNRVTSVVFSGDGQQLASSSHDHTVRIWDLASGNCLQTFEGHSGSVISVAFSGDGQRLASSSHDHTVRIWDSATGYCLQTINIGTLLTKISFGVTGSYLLTEDGRIKIDQSPRPRAATSEASGSAIATVDIGGGLALDEHQRDSQRQDYSLSPSGSWITLSGENVLWLPPEFRPGCFAIRGRTVCIGCSSGRVQVIGFSGVKIHR
ncbi:hypothetical protein B0T24DRAFT_544890 [Lasiosphaeria ovina]|uniref:NACHT domain-containing protein n=1 Tax=Lasiosphaeria ovina TaxID=92902 RepID=A0AAE0NN65_9PEZI|nr:hypothetical protein B0T24DRAFT_544890 [Lasiosphaeria ovina]